MGDYYAIHKTKKNDELIHWKSDQSELMHHGVKGQKWGIRRYRNSDGSLTPKGKKRYSENEKLSRAMRDATKLRDKASNYYQRSNKRNMHHDIEDPWLQTKNGKKMDSYVEQGRRQTAKLVKKLERRYGKGNVSAMPVFEKNGYVVKRTEVIIKELDRQGRLKRVVNSSSPVETYNAERKSGMDYNKKAKALRSKYSAKMANAKTKDERDRLEFEMMEKIDDLDY